MQECLSVNSFIFKYIAKIWKKGEWNFETSKEAGHIYWARLQTAASAVEFLAHLKRTFMRIDYSIGSQEAKIVIISYRPFEAEMKITWSVKYTSPLWNTIYKFVKSDERSALTTELFNLL